MEDTLEKAYHAEHKALRAWVMAQLTGRPQREVQARYDDLINAHDAVVRLLTDVRTAAEAKMAAPRI